MAESEAERAERLRKFAEKHNQGVEDKQDAGRDSKQERTARENLDAKDAES